jgi:MoxR-like ATPase
MKISECSDTLKAMIDEIETVIIGKRGVIEQACFGLLAKGHILFEDYPGLAKTMLVRMISKTLGCSFKRIQFTPDLLPSDITGSYIFDQKTREFVLRKGAVFTNILLCDEINRAPPKTQSALLEAMQERTITLDVETMRLPDPFVVFATQNPIEYEGTYPLPEAQVDRFIMRLRVGYPAKGDEVTILKGRKARKSDEFDVKTIVTPQQVLDMQSSIEDVHVSDPIMEYITDVVRNTRSHQQIEIGSSPRGSLALMKLSMARAAYLDRDYVIPDDVKAVACPALAHRLILKPEPWIKGVKTESVVENVLSKTPVPKGEK